MKISKFALKIILIFAFSTGAMACGYSYHTHANPLDFFHHHHNHHPPHLDLKVSSECHYYQDGADVGCASESGKPFGDWEAADLTCRHKFFSFKDLKPGDSGENTIDLSVTGRDACGTMTIEKIEDTGNRCVEPETQTKQDRDCWHKKTGTKEKNGEIRENLEFQIWLDQGETPGFQGKSDSGEGDNIFNEKDALMMDWTNLEKCPKKFELRKFLRTGRQKHWNECEQADADGDGLKCKEDRCRGFAWDGRLIPGVKYYIGFAWRLPEETGNEAQTDSLKFDVRFTAKGNESCQPCMNTCQHCDDRCED